MRRSPDEAWPEPRAYAGAPRSSAQRGRPAGSPARAPSRTRSAPAQAPNGHPAAARQGTPGPGGKAGLAQVARGGTLNLVGAVFQVIGTFGITVLVTRHFAPAVAGAFFTATSAFLIVQAVASLGANVGLVYFIARLRSLGEEKRIPAIIRAAVIPVVVVSLVLTAVMVLLAGPLASIMLSGHLANGGAVSPGAVATSLRALAFTILFGS